MLSSRLVDLLNAPDVKGLIKNAVEQNKSGEYLYKSDVSEREFNVLFEGKDGKLFAVIRPTH